MGGESEEEVGRMRKEMLLCECQRFSGQLKKLTVAETFQKIQSIRVEAEDAI